MSFFFASSLANGSSASSAVAVVAKTKGNCKSEEEKKEDKRPGPIDRDYLVGRSEEGHSLRQAQQAGSDEVQLNAAQAPTSQWFQCTLPPLKAEICTLVRPACLQ